ncbi:hypothetical protein [Caballeronia sp.]
MVAKSAAWRFGISREQQHALALESQRRASHAVAQGYVREQFVRLD